MAQCQSGLVKARCNTSFLEKAVHSETGRPTLLHDYIPHESGQRKISALGRLAPATTAHVAMDLEVGLGMEVIVCMHYSMYESTDKSYERPWIPGGGATWHQ